MCGIAGVMSRDGSAPDESVLDHLALALSHRGPDGEGRLVAGALGMVHTRLAIIDLETGDQPIRAPGSALGVDAALIANGEIYNYIELRREIGEAAFATKSDCEPPLHIFAEQGLGFAERLRGMFAIAIHDPGDGSLYLARDPFGIKPLYYCDNGAGFAFASEPQALIVAGLARPRLDAAGRDELLQVQFVSGSKTVFDGIQRVAPGETLRIRGGEILAREKRPALPAGGPQELADAEALEALDEVLMESVGVHQRADVPYGMFLSGGVDSSALLACMRDLNERPVQAFTAGFSGTGVADERDHARAVAAAAGADHFEVEFGAEDFWALLPTITSWIDDPAADYAILPTFKLGAIAHEHGLKVILSGEGGDELFAGYGRYRRQLRPRFLGGRPARRRGVFDGLDVLRGHGGGDGWRHGLAAAEAEIKAAAEAAAEAPGRTSLQAAQAADCADWLPHDLLIKLDRCLMAHGVEGRVPFLDSGVADFAFRLPDAMKIRRGQGKWLLRQWLNWKLPEARPFGRKRGFTVPVGEWIQARGAELGPLVARQPGVAEACDAAAVERLYARGGKRQGQAAWGLLFFALWHNCHVLARACDGDVFETLSAGG